VGVVTSVWPQATLPVSDVVVTTSQGGAVYVEATTQRLTLSSCAKRSKLRKCLEQFARLYVQGRTGSDRTGLPISPWNRELDPRKDRLVIATGPDASRRAISLLTAMADAARKNAFDAFKARTDSRANWQQVMSLLIDALRSATRAVETEQSRALAEQDAWRLLQCIHVSRYDFSTDGHDLREALHLLREHVLTQSAEAVGTWNDICKVAQEAAHQGARMDLFQLRQRLTEIGVPLATAPDYRADVDALRRRSADELRGIDDGIHCTPDRGIVVQRKVVDEIADRILEGHVLVYGEPGCGKSWVMRQVAQRCAADSECVFLRVENLQVHSQTDIGLELGIAHPLIDVLKAWQSGQNTIFLDGLDAAREETRIRVICELLQTVIRETTWRVVVSIRTYDKRYSERWSRLLSSFGGSECGVSCLSGEELDVALRQAPDVAAIVECSAPELRDLIHNPFNLRLLVEIVYSTHREHGALESLAGIKGQVGLLEAFWRCRVRRGDNADVRERCVLDAARRMIDVGRLTLARTALLATAVGSELTDLLSEGIIVPRNLRTATFVGMFHNAFFDFACARLLLSMDDAELLRLFADTRKVFFIRPSARLLFSYLLYFDETDKFWRLCRAMLAEPQLPAIWQVVPLDVLADTVVELDQLRGLLAWLDQPRPEDARVATAFLLRSVEIRNRAGPPTTRVWLLFCSELASRIDSTFVNPYLAYLELWSKQPELPGDCAEVVNQCARAVWGRARADDWTFGRLTARATEVIARTIAACPEASQKILSDVANEHNYEECRGLADAMPVVIAVSPSHAADLLIALFSYEEESEDQVSLMPSHVLSLVQSKKQAWEMVWYTLQEHFPMLMSASPIDGTRVVIAVGGFLAKKGRERQAQIRQVMSEVGSAEERRNSATEDDVEPVEGCDLIHVNLASAPFRYEEDRSSIWYGRYSADYREKVLEHFEAWLARADKEPCVSAALSDVFALLFKSNRHAVVWNRCLVAAGKSPESLADHVFPLVAASRVLLSLDSEEFILNLLPTLFPLYDSAHRKVIEQAILSLPKCADDTGARPWLEKIRNRYLTCLPGDALVLEETHCAKRTLGAATGAIPQHQIPEPSDDVWHGFDDDDRRLAAEGVDVTAESYKQLKQLIAPVEQFVESHLNSAPTLAEIRAAFSAITDLEAALWTKAARDAHPLLLRRARTQLASAARTIASGAGIPLREPCYDWAVNHLLGASKDPCPEPTDSDPARDDEGTDLVWSPALRRVEAASGLLSVAARGDIPPEIRGRVEKALLGLSADPVATVREQIAANLCKLYRHARPMMWQLAEYLARQDPSPRVLSVLCDSALSRLLPFHPTEVTKLAIHLLRRNEIAGQKPAVRRSVYGLLILSHVYCAERAAEPVLRSLLTAVSANAEVLRDTVQQLRGAVVYNEDNGHVPAVEIRRRAISWYEAVARGASAAWQALTARHAGQATWPDPAQDELRELAQTLTAVATKLNFSVPEPEKGEGAPLPDSVLFRLLDEGAALFDLLAEIDYPAVNSDFVQLLKKLLHVDPKRIVGLLAPQASRGIHT